MTNSFNISVDDIIKAINEYYGRNYSDNIRFKIEASYAVDLPSGKAFDITEMCEMPRAYKLTGAVLEAPTKKD